MIRRSIRWIYVHLWTLPRFRRTYTSLPLAETFREIYRTRAWGDNGDRFCSGAGSHGEASDAYCSFVTKFIRDKQVQTVVDLGCGDFSVGRRIVEASGVRYHGVDVVPELIAFHKNTVHGLQASFQCADITKDALPSSDLCLVRQVLQHLSNDEIAKVLANLANFNHILISEEVLVRPRSFNQDKAHGPDVRAYYGSGVYVERPPFSKKCSHVWEVPLTDRTLLRTVLLEPAQSSAQAEPILASRDADRIDLSLGPVFKESQY